MIGAALTNPLDDHPCSVAAFAGLVGRLARLLGDLLAGPLAFGADVFPGAGRALVRIIVGGMMSEWVLGLHGLRPVLRRRDNGRRTLATTFISDALDCGVARQNNILEPPEPFLADTHLATGERYGRRKD